MSGANNQGEFSRQRALEKQRKEMLVRGRNVRARVGDLADRVNHRRNLSGRNRL